MMFRRFGLPFVLLLMVLGTGTIGYWYIGHGQYSVLDGLFMTFITIATIGYTEVIDVSHNPGGQIFTMLIALFGIGVLAYIATSFTAFIVEGELTQSFRRRRMERTAQQLKSHYIVCGRGAVGSNVIAELRATGRSYVVIDSEEVPSKARDEISILGAASDDETLITAGIKNASGLFAVVGDDNLNMVISLSARALNPALRIVTRCSDKENMDKVMRAGADAAVSPTYIGGLRMASEMLRPHAVSFLDTMLRDLKNNIRVEELPITTELAGKTIASIGLKNFSNILLLAIQNGNEWVYNPPQDYALKQGDVLVYMATPGERAGLEGLIQNTPA